ADRVTVLRQGTTVLPAEPVSAQNEASLAAAMLGASGRALTAQPRAPGTRARQEVTRIAGVAIRSGELVGIAADAGNGQRERLRQLARSLRDAGAAGFIPEDRTTEGLIPELSITENLLLGREHDSLWSRGGRIDWPAARRHASMLIQEFDIRASGPDNP